MNTENVDLGLYLAFAILGFLLKFALERYSKHKDEIRLQAWQLDVAAHEQKLSQFYWPIYCRLKRGSIAWKSENFRREANTKAGQEFGESFDKLVIVRNHEETREIIQKNFHHFGGDETLELALIKLLHHIDVYLSLRAAGSKNDPIWVGQPWPNEIELLIEKKLHALQENYDKLLAAAGRWL